jgi:urea transport system substrate-binding protein
MTIATAENRDFVQRYQAKFGRDAIMDAIGEGMYTAVNLYVKGAEKTGSLDKEAVVDGMVQASFADPKGQIHIDKGTHCAYLSDYIAEIAAPSSAPAWQRLKIVQRIADIKPQQPCLQKPPG